MKTNRPLACFLRLVALKHCPPGTSLAAAIAALALAASPASAATIYWDGATAGWDNTASWSTDPNATTPNPAAVPGASDDVVFNISTALTLSTISLNANQAVNSISLISTLTGNPTIQGNTVASANRTLTIGAGGITSQSTLGFVLGSTTANQGVNVELAASQAWTLLQAGATQNFVVRNGVSRSAGAGNQTLLLDATLKTTFGGIVADGTGGGKLSLWKRGSGEAILSVANTLSGTTTLQAGRLTIGNATGLGTAALQLAGGTLNVAAATNFTAPSTVSMLGGVTSLVVADTTTSSMNLGTISRSVGGGLLARSFVGTGQLTANITVGNSLVNGIIGPWAYGQTAANVPTWLTISSGIIAPATLTSVTNANNLTSGNGTYTSASTGTTTLAADRAAYVWANTGAGGTTDLGDFNLTLSAFSTGAGNQTISGTGTGRLVIGGNELILIPSNGAIIISAGIASGTGHLTIAPYGNGNVTLSGSNAHSGGTSIHKNTLNVNSANALGTGTFTISGGNIDNTSAGDITLATNNAQVWNTDFTYAGATRNLNMGTGSVSLGTYAGATRTVTVTGNTLTIGGAISNGTHADLPTTGLTKTGAGTLVLSGINTYTGTTTVSAGAMTLTDNAQLKFVIGASGINNSLNGIGTVNLDGDFNFNLTGAGTTIGNSWNIINVSTLTETFNGTFSVVGFTRQGGGTGAGLWDGSANSAQYQFDTASGLLTVVPEPSTWALLAFSLTTIMVLRRRRQS